MRTRDDVYLDILSFGLLVIRAEATKGNVEACMIEADHLHNIPSLIGETNQSRHQYYFDLERTLYIDRCEKLASTEEAKFALKRYRELWAELEKFNAQDKT